MKDFYFPMKTREKIAGWIYLLIHAVLMQRFILPLLLDIFTKNGIEVDNLQMNVIYYVIGLVYILLFMTHFLRESYYMEKKARLLSTVIMGFAIFYVFNVVLNYAIIIFGIEIPNANNDNIIDLISKNIYTMAAITVIMAPIVEEVLFRGVLFGTFRKKSKVLAFVVSILLFAVYHVWASVYVYQDWIYLLGMIDYLPAGFALAWVYERSNNIWYCILLHMLINGIAVLGQIALM